MRMEIETARLSGQGGYCLLERLVLRGDIICLWTVSKTIDVIVIRCIEMGFPFQQELMGGAAVTYQYS